MTHCGGDVTGRSGAKCRIFVGGHWTCWKISPFLSPMRQSGIEIDEVCYWMRADTPSVHLLKRDKVRKIYPHHADEQ